MKRHHLLFHCIWVLALVAGGIILITNPLMVNSGMPNLSEFQIKETKIIGGFVVFMGLVWIFLAFYSYQQKSKSH